MRRKNERPRLRDLGLCPGALPTGKWNAITDVKGVRVGHVTLVRGKPGPRVVGKGPVRTGVTVVIPGPGNIYSNRFRAAVETINGFGKPVGFEQVREMGTLETPIVLTNTLSVPVAAAALIEHTLKKNPGVRSVNPVVAECNDGGLNDIAGRHVTRKHVLEAIAKARRGPVPEGNVGAGTGMSAFGFKAGIGTASRVVPKGQGGYTVGILTLTNAGSLPHLRICGLPVGAELLREQSGELDCEDVPRPVLSGLGETRPRPGGTGPARARGSEEPGEEGSIVLVLATDAPVLERQLGRLARRVVHGLARVGLTSGSGSGDFVIAFTTANRVKTVKRRISRQVEELNEARISVLFDAVIEATEEAYLNSILRCETMGGAATLNVPVGPSGKKLLSGRPCLHSRQAKLAGCDGLVRRAIPLDFLRAYVRRASGILPGAGTTPQD